jgi:DNA-directed RNA polymerase specialized sigma24 family protein
MESTVAQVSRYLDRGGVVLFSREIDGLVILAFRKAVYRRTAKLRRVESWGGTAELSNRAVDHTWAQRVHSHLELEHVVRLLSERSRTILALRYAGYNWKESSKLLGVSVSALRSTFWRDVARVKGRLKSQIPAQTGSRTSRDVPRSDDPRC